MAGYNEPRVAIRIFAIGLAFFLLLASLFSSSAQEPAPSIRLVRIMESDETGLASPAGLAYSPSSKAFYVFEQGAQGLSLETQAIQISTFDGLVGLARIPETIYDPLNVAFDNKANRLLILQSADNQLLELRENAGGSLPGTIARRYNTQLFGIQEAQGMTVDPASGSLFILDLAGPRILRLTPSAGGSFENAKVSTLDLQTSGILAPRGIALEPASGRLHVLDVGSKTLFELSQSGQVTATRDLSAFLPGNPQGMVFAPSGDQTDDPAQMSLYIADSGQGIQADQNSPALLESQSTVLVDAAQDTPGQILELSLAQPMAAQEDTFTSATVRVTDLSTINPPSPDASGITWLPDSNTLMVVDGEVEETVSGITHFQGANVWELTMTGEVVRTANISTVAPTLVPMTNEPTDITWNPYNGHYYISQDDGKEIFDLNPGLDGLVGTADDTWTSFDTAIFGSGDPEGITYDTWYNRIFVADGNNAEVYEYTTTGILVSQFDVLQYGVVDPESIQFNPLSGTLFVMSSNRSSPVMIETTLDGVLLQTISVAPSNIRTPAGLAYAPASDGSGVMRFYIADRGVDNNTNPLLIDGKLYELTAPVPVIQPSPTVTFTPTSTLTPSPTSTPDPNSSPTPTQTPTVGPTSTSTPTPEPPPSNLPLYASFANNSSIGGLAFSDEDVLHFNGSTWSIYFDGSDVGLNSIDVDGFFPWDNDTILLSFDKAVRVSGIDVEAWDIVQFDAVSLGANTAGTFSLYLDGIDVGLDTSAENIDALYVLPDGHILISTSGDPIVPGLNGLANEDILEFTPLTLGSNTSGTWAVYLDGSTVGLGDLNENIDAVHISQSGALYLSTSAEFSVAGIWGFGEDVFVCSPVTPELNALESVTECDYSPILYFDGSSWGMIGNNLDAFSLLDAGTMPTPTFTPTNTPTSTATPTATNTPTNTATATAVSMPAIALELYVNGNPADTPPGLFLQVGSVVSWTYAVTNNGNVALNSIQVTDDQGTSISCPGSTLVPTASMTCSATGTATSGQFSKTATAVGIPAYGPANVSVSDPVYYFGSAPAVSLVTSTNGQDANIAPGPYILAGQAVDWTYLVSNTGNVSLAGITVTDNRGVTLSCPGTTLTPNTSFTCTASSTAAAGQYSNLGTVTANPPPGLSQVSATDPSNYFGVVKSISLAALTNSQEADNTPGPYILVGQAVSWTYAITNTGNVMLSELILADSRLGQVNCPTSSLAPGASTTCSANGTATAGQYGNVATISGTLPGSLGKIGTTDPSHYFGTSLVVDLQVLVNGRTASEAPGPNTQVGTTFIWSFTVRNPGNVPLQVIVLDDNLLGAVTCPQSSLSAGAEMVCTANETPAVGQHTHVTTVQASFEGFNVQAVRTSYHVGNYAVYLPMIRR